MKPLAIDLYCGLGGWAHGFLAEGYDVVGFDIERHQYGSERYPGQLVLQDVRTLHGSQFRRAAVIVASPPCQRYSYMAQPWDRAKREIRWQEWERESPFGDFRLNDLFEACFRIAREAGVPVVVENVKGAQKWVGRAKWHYGSYYLWGDVPALMPMTLKLKNTGGSWFGQRDGKTLDRNDPRDLRRDENGEWVNAEARGGWNHPGKVFDGRKNEGGSWFAVAHNTESGVGRNPVDRSGARKAASALIAKIPYDLAQWIARCYKPEACDSLRMPLSGVRREPTAKQEAVG